MDPEGRPPPPDDMLLQERSNFYPAGSISEQTTSSAFSRSDGTRVHPHASQQPSTPTHNLSMASVAQPGCFLNAHHDLYPAPSEAHHPRPGGYHHGSPQSWPPYEQGLSTSMASGMPHSYDSFPSASPFPPPRLSPPPATALAVGPYPHPGRHGPLAGSLDPATGIFYRTPDHPRLRTAQACEKCRTRKAKCSGDHPSCKRCISRGLVCEYAKEGRVRGPNKPKPKLAQTPSDVGEQTASSRNRSSSTNTSSSTASLDHFDIPTILTSLREGRIGIPQQPSISPTRSRRNSLSLSEHRADRPRPPNLQLETTSNHYRLHAGHGSNTAPPHSLYFAHPPAQPAYHSTGMSRTDAVEGYASQEPVALPQHQQMYVQGEPVSLIQPSYPEAVSNSRLVLAQAPVLDQQQQMQHRFQSHNVLAQTPNALNQYHVPLDDSTNPGYSGSGSSGRDMSNLAHSESVGLSRYQVQGDYSPIPVDTQTLQHHADAPGMSIAHSAPITPTWVELRPPSNSLRGAGASGSSSTATESSFRLLHSGGTLPEHLVAQDGSLSIAGQTQAAQNMSRSPGTFGDPHRSAAGMGSVGTESAGDPHTTRVRGTAHQSFRLNLPIGD